MEEALHQQLLTAVAQQLSSPQTLYVAKTYERLLKLGFDETDAKEQIALCLGEEMDVMLRKKREFDEKQYRARLDGLPLDEDDDDDLHEHEEHAEHDEEHSNGEEHPKGKLEEA